MHCMQSKSHSQFLSIKSGGKREKSQEKRREMGSHGRDNGFTQTESQQLKSDALYSLTLDEVQNQLGDLEKPLISMNLDELVKTLWTAEFSLGIGKKDSTSGAGKKHDQVSSGFSLRRQSSITLSRDLSKKTVNEVWRDIKQGQKRNNLDRNIQERQPTLSEITLGDFLVKAGVVGQSVMAKKKLGSDQVALPQQDAQWMHYQSHSMHQPEQHQPQNIVPVFMPGHPGQRHIPVDGVYHETQMTVSPSALMGTLSDTQTPGRKRIAPCDSIEKSVERRQKRMIKNRESAARSCARKQAYTHELENKVSRLEEENERLRRQKEMEKLLRSTASQEPKYQLRRTSSGPL